MSDSTPEIGLCRFNLTGSYYAALGENRNSPISGVESDIRAFFFAAEPSYDFDFVRVRGSFLYATGDKDPFDDVDGGFDAVFENPQFAGADTSYWIRQAIPLIGGGFVSLSGRNAVLPSLRSSKEEGQSNFTNPGLILVGAGADIDVTPELRFSTNVNYLRFDETAVLEVARQQADIPNEIGWDISGAFIYRPFQTQNVILRLSGAILVPGAGYDALFGSAEDDDVLYSVLANITLTY